VLARFLESAVEQRALSEMAALLGAATAEGAAVRIRIAGPEALLAHLRRQPAARAAAIEYSVAADKAEVSVTIGDTVMETQLAAWGERIVAAVAGDSDV
jgi:CYTH domain-containing protein